MRVLLVNPFGTEQESFSGPPLGLLYLAGTLLGHGLEVMVVDGCLDGPEGIRRALSEHDPGLVGITCLTPGRHQALEVAGMVKAYDPRVKVVLGGAHPSIMHRQILDHYPNVDFVVIGEGEQTLLELACGRDPSQVAGLAFRVDGRVAKTPPRPHAQNLDDLPFPAWHLVDLHRYPGLGTGTFRGIKLSKAPRVSVVFSRGCMGHCSFCSTWWLWRGWRHRSAGNMGEELELLNRRFGIRHFCFADDAMTVDRQATLELCDEIRARRLDIGFHVTTRTDCVDEELLRRLQEAGCYKIAFGVETASSQLLAAMGKENEVAAGERAIGLCKKIKLPVTALMIVGNVGETEETIRETVTFLRRTQPDDVGSVGGLWVLPGTQLYQSCRRQGIIDDDFWLSAEPYMVYTKEHSPSELSRMRRRVSGYRPWPRRISAMARRFLG